MTDLHTHILPGLDDGAKDLASSLALLEQECSQGVRHVVLTSHYHCEAEELASFLSRRDRAFSELLLAAPAGVELKLGCEVFFSPELLRIDAEKLCLEGTNVLLLELPVLQRPAFLREVLTGLRERGIVPLIAHVERYSYVRNDPAMLSEWISLGALIQVNAASLLDGDARLVLKLLKWGLVQVIASDTHSVRYRPPNLRRAMDVVAKSLGTEKARELERNAKRIFSGRSLPKKDSHVPKKVLGFWV